MQLMLHSTTMTMAGVDNRAAHHRPRREGYKVLLVERKAVDLLGISWRSGSNIIEHKANWYAPPSTTCATWLIALQTTALSYL